MLTSNRLKTSCNKIPVITFMHRSGKIVGKGNEDRTLGHIQSWDAVEPRRDAAIPDQDP